MNIEQFAEFNKALAENPQPANWRKGQWLMNVLHRVSPADYARITATSADPFYRNDRIPAFWDSLTEGEQ